MEFATDRPLGDAPGYGQLCAVGFALDVVGDRWTLLVLRDLARSPLRFRDLQAINPGMSPNLLTTRLNKLTQAGLVTRQPVPHSKGHTYALTGDTRDMVLPMLSATANLGAFLIDRLPIEDLMAMDLPTVMAHQMQLNGHFVRARMPSIAGHFLIDLGGIATHLLLDSHDFSARAEPFDADLRATIAVFPPSVLMRIMGHAMTVAEAESTGMLTITGDRDAGLELLALLSFAPAS